MTIFGYTVRLPDIEPFMGEDRPPQFTATKVIIIAIIAKTTSKQRAISYNQSHSRCTWEYSIFVPLQKLSFSLQFPVDRHSLIFDPRRVKPSSHISCTLFGYVVRLPTKDPLLRVLRGPQSFAVGKNVDKSTLDHSQDVYILTKTVWLECFLFILFHSFRHFTFASRLVTIPCSIRLALSYRGTT